MLQKTTHCTFNKLFKEQIRRFRHSFSHDESLVSTLITTLESRPSIHLLIIPLIPKGVTGVGAWLSLSKRQGTPTGWSQVSLSADIQKQTTRPTQTQNNRQFRVSGLFSKYVFGQWKDGRREKRLIFEWGAEIEYEVSKQKHK